MHDHVDGQTLSQLGSNHLIFMGGGGQKNWPEKKFASDILLKKKVCFWPIMYKKLCLIWWFLKKKSLLFRNTRKKVCFTGNLLATPINIKWPLLKAEMPVDGQAPTIGTHLSHARLYQHPCPDAATDQPRPRMGEHHNRGWAHRKMVLQGIQNLCQLATHQSDWPDVLNFTNVIQ